MPLCYNVPNWHWFLLAGVALLPATTVESLLVDKRRMELVQPFKLALLKLSSQVRGYKALSQPTDKPKHELI